MMITVRQLIPTVEENARLAAKPFGAGVWNVTENTVHGTAVDLIFIAEREGDIIGASHVHVYNRMDGVRIAHQTSMGTVGAIEMLSAHVRGIGGQPHSLMWTTLAETVKVFEG